MTISRVDPQHPKQQLYRAWEQALNRAAVSDVRVYESELVFVLTDGRELTVPMSWFPRLEHGTQEERKNFRLIAEGAMVEWPDLDDGVEIQHLLLGWEDGEGRASFERWLREREAAKKA